MYLLQTPFHSWVLAQAQCPYKLERPYWSLGQPSFSSSTSSSTLMPLLVQRQMIAPCKLPVALATLKRLLACVLAKVSCQFIAASEPPLTSVPAAFVRLLTWKKRKIMYTPTCWTKGPYMNSYWVRHEMFFVNLHAPRIHIFANNPSNVCPPVCVRWCAFRWELFEYTLLQFLNVHLCVLATLIFGCCCEEDLTSMGVMVRTRRLDDASPLFNFRRVDL